MAGKEATKGGTLCTTTFEGRENRVIFERWGETQDDEGEIAVLGGND